MSAGNPFPEDAEDTQTAIMRATFDALVEYGYAGLTIDRIDEFFPKSKSLLYHHYDGKDDLLVDFLSRMIDDYEAEIDCETPGDARERLDRWLDAIARPELAEEDRGFIRALVELRAQAAHDERYREHFTRSDRFFRGWLADIIADGIEEGVFREVDPEQVAATIHTIAGGVMTDRVTSDDPQVADVRAELDAYVEARLLAD
ncbi:TetR/AcrR family transcriptional regulator [Halapricum hydrolyticum]|uniref:TetR family transcriptional regulator n=1 Tax=Halapricum hydrolyticum TaxID=2979991 RepID=A0AAE3LI74_9EURY|nr:TetR family transcriptional regulator C-terminal domain-containing protein [Halapricum hydrolyticum]MCU4717047.1 TetR family transcriptional regulator [Halapricum hydrolyticum]MCU4725973.1 TetR family transcriptional regulator [Halapricum hydrolyticum]